MSEKTKDVPAVLGTTVPQVMGTLSKVATFEEMRAQANVMVESGFLPRGLDTPEKLIAVMLRGRELGLPPMMAVSSLYPVHGQVSADGKTLLAIVYNSGTLEDIKFEETPTSCTVTITRKGFSPFVSKWTDADTKLAGLSNKETHKKYPVALRRWRAVTAGLRITHPDIIGGMYSGEELGQVPTQQFATLPADTKTVIEGEVTNEIIEDDAPIADWLDFMRAAKALGRSSKEAMYLLECSDISEAKQKFGDPQATLDALKDVLAKKGSADKRDTLLAMIAGVYDTDIPGLTEIGVVKYIDDRLEQDPDLDAESFDLSELFTESGELFGTGGEKSKAKPVEGKATESKD